MKNTFCDIIKDLLPLYAENMVSESSKNLIEDHFSECENCKKEYEKITADVKVADTSNENIVKLKKEIKKKSVKKVIIATLTSVVAVVMIAILLLFIFKPYLYTWIYPGDRITLNITYENEGYPITFNNHDIIVKSHSNLNQYNLDVDGDTTVISIEADEYGRYNVFINAYSLPLPAVCITIDHFNWWEIYNCDLDISIDSDTELLTYTYTASKTLENGTVDIETDQNTAGTELDENNDEIYNIYLG